MGRGEPGLTGIFPTESLLAAVDCAQCPNVAANLTALAQTGRLDMTREVFPWLEIAIGKYSILTFVLMNATNKIAFRLANLYFTLGDVCAQKVAQKVQREGDA